MASLLFPFFEVSRGIHFRFAEISRKKKKERYREKKEEANIRDIEKQ